MYNVNKFAVKRIKDSAHYLAFTIKYIAMNGVLAVLTGNKMDLLKSIGKVSYM